MNRYTTPTLTLTIEGINLTGMDVYVTFAQGRVVLTKTLDDGVALAINSGNSVLSVYLDQRETATLGTGNARVQVNWINASGTRVATRIKEVSVRQNLLEEVLTYGG